MVYSTSTEAEKSSAGMVVSGPHHHANKLRVPRKRSDAALRERRLRCTGATGSGTRRDTRAGVTAGVDDVIFHEESGASQEFPRKMAHIATPDRLPTLLTPMLSL